MSSQGNHHDGQGMVVTIQIKCMTLNHLCHVGKKTTWLIHNKKIVKDKKKKKITNPNISTKTPCDINTNTDLQHNLEQSA